MIQFLLRSGGLAAGCVLWAASVGQMARAQTATAPSGTFRFQLFSDSAILDPQVAGGASSNFLFHQIYRGLYTYHSKRGLSLAGAKSCVRRGQTLRCDLRKLSFSDGQPIEATNYVASFRRLLTKETASPHADLLFSLKNARAIHSGSLSADKLGVRALGPLALEFTFAETDLEFEYKLIHPALSPLPNGGFRDREHVLELPSSGPYRITEWKKGSRIFFTPNEAIVGGGRPNLEALVIDDDATALTMYEAGKLDFLRRLVANNIPRFKGKVDFHQIAMARFDYIGFGSALASAQHLRAALVQAVDFKGFLSLFDTKTPPGCPSMPQSWTGSIACQSFDPGKAKEQLSKSQALAPKLEFFFSRLGGDDIAKAAEWFQGQWKKNLGLTIELRSQEQGTYLTLLKQSPPAIFRKGVSLDRPTCLAALEIFTKGHPENFIALQDAEYEAQVAALRKASTPAVRKNACRRAVERLLAVQRLIPLGEMYFTLLVSPRFSGWDLNELNQLDLSELRQVPD